MDKTRKEFPMAENDRFENVTAMKKANVYYDGKVTSRTILFADGTRKTLGVMLPGEYEFSTGVSESMEILAGEMKVLLPDAKEWRVYKEGESFQIAANESFKLKIEVVADYCCSYG
jgi:purine/pyrimidine-nucleoside phosphorylase